MDANVLKNTTQQEKTQQAFLLVTKPEKEGGKKTVLWVEMKE